MIIEKNNETKLVLKINKILKPLARLTKKKRGHKIRNKRGDITTDSTEKQRIVSDYYEQLCTNKLDNLEEMEKFLETYNVPRLSHKEMENLNRPITSKEIEPVIRNLPMYKSSGPYDFASEFYHTFKEELIPIFLKLFHNLEEEKVLPNLLYETCITLI
uniref:Uncharacterized protein n=1 Tax=Rousettus aegyptiacus TaxID=9407 RepID=A0A7J8JHY7_ROUAE|nr:hypothetical protein HJG63_010245 [Rousettus aegyptiacus]